MFYGNSLIAAACKLKLKAKNPSYIKNYVSGNFLFFIDVDFCAYSTLHR